jgi:hypothetical protein
MRFWLKMILANLSAPAVGAFVYWGMSELLGLARHPAAIWIFVILLSWWAATGYFYTLDQIHPRKRNARRWHARISGSQAGRMA